jgi:hypothetical protein
MTDRKPRIGILGIMQDLYDEMIPGIAQRQAATPARSPRNWPAWASSFPASRSSSARTRNVRCGPLAAVSSLMAGIEFVQV